MDPMTDSSAPASRPGGRGRADESMSLLVDIASSALDPGYADAALHRLAAGRDDSGSGPDGGRRRWLTIGGVLAATLLIVIAGVQTHEQAPQALRARGALISQVERRTDAVTTLQHQLDGLRGQIAGLRAQVLASTAAGSSLAGRLATEELVAGTVAVSGPGLRVVLDDAQPAEASNRVLDRDLQGVVNALWAAGAEAVAVGNQRLTGQTAIRQAGSAILVNFQRVAPPYVVQAVGDAVDLETSFGVSRAAGRMRTLAQLYGLRFDVTRESSVRLPSAPGLTLRYAEPTGAAAAGEGRP
ncbi:MAG: hypothetical protein QOJ03_2355 [Frankiaceae bacterium]|jgi:uncharacterized protein YlxW (UPF0749 family)|nr:hypothetical protein [Frankiaceae bacterium]